MTTFELSTSANNRLMSSLRGRETALEYDFTDLGSVFELTTETYFLFEAVGAAKYARLVS